MPCAFNPHLIRVCALVNVYKCQPLKSTLLSSCKKSQSTTEEYTGCKKKSEEVFVTCKIFLAKTISKAVCLVDIFRRQHYMHPLGKRLGTFGPFKCLELQFVLHSLPTSVVSECAGILSTKTFVWWTVYNSSHGQSNSQSWCSDAVTQKFLLTLMPSPFFSEKRSSRMWNIETVQLVRLLHE